MSTSQITGCTSKPNWPCLIAKLRTFILLQQLFRLRKVIFNQVKECAVVLLGDAWVMDKQCPECDESVCCLNNAVDFKPQRRSFLESLRGEIWTFLHSFTEASESGFERKTSRSTIGRMTSDISNDTPGIWSSTKGLKTKAQCASGGR